MAVLFFHRKRKDIRELLAVPVNISLADLHLDLNANERIHLKSTFRLNDYLSWDVIAALSGFSIAHNTLGSIPIVLSALIPLTVELHGVGTGDIVYHLFFHVAVDCHSLIF